MPRELWVHETITGIPIMQLHPEGGSWRSAISGISTGSFRFRLADEMLELKQSDLRYWLQPNTHTLVVSSGSHVEFAGISMTPTYRRADASLEVPTRSVRELFAQRGTYGVGDHINGGLSIVNRTHAGAVAMIAGRMIGPGTGWDLPLDMPANASGVYSDVVNWWEHVDGESLLQRVEAEGYEVYLRPYKTAAGWLRYQILVSKQVTVGSAFHVPVTVPDSPVTNLSVMQDGTKQLTGVSVIGEGTEMDTRMGAAGGMNGPAIPTRDAFVRMKEIADVGALNRIAAAELAARRFPIEQWSFDVVTGDVPSSAVAPGSLLDLDVRDDPWIPNGVYRQRVIAVRGDFGSSVVSPEVQLYG